MVAAILHNKNIIQCTLIIIFTFFFFLSTYSSFLSGSLLVLLNEPIPDATAFVGDVVRSRMSAETQGGCSVAVARSQFAYIGVTFKENNKKIEKSRNIKKERETMAPTSFAALEIVLISTNGNEVERKATANDGGSLSLLAAIRNDSPRVESEIGTEERRRAWAVR